MGFLPETIQVVSEWTAETIISYVPNARKGSAKSAERYSRYSQAKTVGDALNLGCKPEDLLHDYEKKFLVVGAAHLSEVQEPMAHAEVATTAAPAPTSPPPTVRGGLDALFGMERSSEKRPAPQRHLSPGEERSSEKRPAPQRHLSPGEETPQPKRSRHEPESTAPPPIGHAVVEPLTPAGRATVESSRDLSSAEFKPELQANLLEFGRDDFHALVVALELGTVTAVTNYFRLVLHSSKDPEARLQAVLAVLAPMAKMPSRYLRRAVATAFSMKVRPDDDIVKAAVDGRRNRKQGEQRLPTVLRVAETFSAASDSVRGDMDPVVRNRQESLAVGILAKVLAGVRPDGKDSEVLVHLLRGKSALGRTTVLQALGCAVALTRPPCRAEGKSAAARIFRSEAAKHAYLTAFGKAVPQAFAEAGGFCTDILAALMEDSAPAQLLSRCAPSGGSPVLPMEASEISDVGVALLKLAGLEVAIERRYIGRRVQIHRLGDCVAVFGPDQQDLGEGLGAEQLAAIRVALTAKACIIDAVAVSYSQAGIDEVCFMAFDCLWLNGQVLARKSLRERQNALLRTVAPCEFLQVAPQERFFADAPPSADDVAALLADAKASGSSGLIFKSLSCAYEAGTTSNAWLSLRAPVQQ